MKHCRLAINQLKEEIPDLRVTLLRQRTHVIYELKLGDVVRHLSISTSPKNCDHAVARAVKDAKQLLGIPK